MDKLTKQVSELKRFSKKTNYEYRMDYLLQDMMVSEADRDSKGMKPQNRNFKVVNQKKRSLHEESLIEENDTAAPQDYAFYLANNWICPLIGEKICENNKELYGELLCKIFMMSKEAATSRMNELFSDRSFEGFIIYQKKQLLGCLCLYYGTTAVTLFDFGVVVEQQNKGFGKVLLRQLIQYLEQYYPKFTRLILQVSSTNKAAVHLYQSHGFQITQKQICR